MVTFLRVTSRTSVQRFTEYLQRTYLSFHHDIMYNCLRNPNVPRMHKKLPYNKYSSQPTTYVLYIFWVSIFAYVRKNAYYLHTGNLSFDWNTYALISTLCVCYGNVFLELVPTGCIPKNVNLKNSLFDIMPVDPRFGIKWHHIFSFEHWYLVENYIHTTSIFMLS